jgi:hypothetical protein
LCLTNSKKYQFILLPFDRSPDPPIIGNESKKLPKSIGTQAELLKFLWTMSSSQSHKDIVQRNLSNLAWVPIDFVSS